MYDFVVTKSGKEVSIVNPKEEQIDFSDIAFTLARIKRFNGNSELTVAQHSLLVMKILKDSGGNGEEQLLGLLHDATEAYIGDMPAPIKCIEEKENSPFVRLESKLHNVILNKVGLSRCDDTLTGKVKQADMEAMEIEANKFIGSTKNFRTDKMKTSDKYSNELEVMDTESVQNKYITELNRLVKEVNNK